MSSLRNSHIVIPSFRRSPESSHCRDSDNDNLQCRSLMDPGLRQGDVPKYSTITTFTILCTLFLLSACGFTPVYQQGAAKESLSAIRIEAPNTRDDQQLKAMLEDMLAPSGQTTPRYRLTPGLGITIEPLSIDLDGTTRRYRLLGTATPALTDLDTGQTVFTTRIQRFNSYHISDADYSTYVAAQNAREELLGLMAEEIRLRLITHFSQTGQ